MKKIHCDNCGNDLTNDNGIDDYRLQLQCQKLPYGSNVRISVYVYPLLEEDKHFCGFGCLKKWMDKEMTDCKKKSEFYHFGILPRICIHSPIEDQYSCMYKPQEICDCGCNEWIDGKMKMFEDTDTHKFPLRDVHRCKGCNGIRIAYRN